MKLKDIRKFGLSYCDLPTMIWNVSFMLRALTLNIDTRCQKRIPIIFYIFTALIAAGYFYVYLVSVLWFVFGRCSQTGDILAALIVFSLGVSSEIGTLKLVYMFLYIDKVKKIVRECLACDALVTPNSRFANNLLTTLKLVKKRAMVFWFVIIMNGVVYIVKPLLLPGRHFMEDKVILYGLEPMYASPNYEISFLLMVLGVIFTCYLPANITAFLIVITGYVEASMLAWSEELNHLWSDAKSYTNQDKTAFNKYVENKLIEIIRGHASARSLLQQVESIFRGAIAIEFTLLIIGLIAELLGGLENTYIQVPFALMQVAMDCLTGQRIMDASNIFERSVYDCKWEDFDLNNMKIVQVMLQSSQRTLKMSAGGIAMLSFSCLMSVIKSIYSAYTTLRTTMK